MKSEFNMPLVYTILVKCFQQQANLTLLVIEKGASEHFPHNPFAHESHGASSGPNSPLCSLLDVIIGLTRTLILFNLNEYATRKKICRHKELPGQWSVCSQQHYSKEKTRDSDQNGIILHNFLFPQTQGRTEYSCYKNENPITQTNLRVGQSNKNLLMKAIYHLCPACLICEQWRATIWYLAAAANSFQTYSEKWGWSMPSGPRPFNVFIWKLIVNTLRRSFKVATMKKWWEFCSSTRRRRRISRIRPQFNRTRRYWLLSWWNGRCPGRGLWGWVRRKWRGNGRGRWEKIVLISRTYTDRERRWRCWWWRCGRWLMVIRTWRNGFQFTLCIRFHFTTEFSEPFQNHNWAFNTDWALPKMPWISCNFWPFSFFGNFCDQPFYWVEEYRSLHHL